MPRKCPECGGINLDKKSEDGEWVVYECRNMNCKLFENNNKKPAYDGIEMMVLEV